MWCGYVENIFTDFVKYICVLAIEHDDANV